jgi:hypothetical protein
MPEKHMILHNTPRVYVQTHTDGTGVMSRESLIGTMWFTVRTPFWLKLPLASSR